MRVKTNLKRSLVVLSCASTLAFSNLAALAEDFSQSHIEAARGVVKASGSTDRFDAILPQILQDTKERFISARPDLEAQITEVANDEAVKIASRRRDLEDEIANIFARIFSEEELSELETFYSTSTGQKLLKEIGVIDRQSLAASRVWATGIARDLENSVDKVLVEKFKASINDDGSVEPDATDAADGEDVKPAAE